MRRRVLNALAVAVVVLAGLSPVIAHSGGTDSCGGHNDRKKGGYHVHNWTKYCSCHPTSSSCSSRSSTPSQGETTPAEVTTTAPETPVTTAELLARIEKLEARVKALEQKIDRKD